MEVLSLSISVYFHSKSESCILNSNQKEEVIDNSTFKLIIFEGIPLITCVFFFAPMHLELNKLCLLEIKKVSFKTKKINIVVCFSKISLGLVLFVLPGS